jgi:hypothetical protein
MTRVYWRCNGGHYFSSLNSPFDGWSSDELSQLKTAAKKLKIRGANPSIAALGDGGASELALRRALVVEFGSARSAFEAIAPDYCVIHDTSMRLHRAETDFH